MAEKTKTIELVGNHDQRRKARLAIARMERRIARAEKRKRNG